MFLSHWRVLLRRWYVVLLGLQATVILCNATTVLVPAKYQATSDVLLLPPMSATTQQGDNPFLALGGLDTVSGVLARTMTDHATEQQIKAAGAPGSYTVVPDLTSGGPVLLITAQDITSAGALRTLVAVSTRLPQMLANLQTTAGVPVSSLIRAKEITRDTTTQPVRKSLIRALIAAAAGGLAVTVLAAAQLDGYLLRRKDRRRRLRNSAKGKTDTTPPADTTSPAGSVVLTHDGVARSPSSRGSVPPTATAAAQMQPSQRGLPRPYLIPTAELDDPVDFWQPSRRPPPDPVGQPPR